MARRAAWRTTCSTRKQTCTMRGFRPKLTSSTKEGPTLWCWIWPRRCVACSRMDPHMDSPMHTNDVARAPAVAAMATRCATTRRSTWFLIVYIPLRLLGKRWQTSIHTPLGTPKVRLWTHGLSRTRWLHRIQELPTIRGHLSTCRMAIRVWQIVCG